MPEAPEASEKAGSQPVKPATPQRPAKAHEQSRQRQPDQRAAVIENGLRLAADCAAEKVFVFVDSEAECRWVLRSGAAETAASEAEEANRPPISVILIIPRKLDVKDSEIKKAGYEPLRSWSGNQSRFSRIKYAFLHAVQKQVVSASSKVVCVLGPWAKGHLDTITVHDLSLSWGDEFPFDPTPLMAKKSFNTVMAALDIALDIGAMGREGKPVGTIMVIGNSKTVMKTSRQAVFNPFKGYPKREKMITNPEVVESIKELAQLDGAVVISSAGVVMAAGRHLEAVSPVTKELRGLGSRHRAAAGITRKTEAVAIVVSESTGRITVFEKGRILATLEPVISRRLA